MIRAVRPAGRVPSNVGWVIVDLPIDGTMINRLYDETGVKAGAIGLPGASTSRSAAAPGGQSGDRRRGSRSSATR